MTYQHPISDQTRTAARIRSLYALWPYLLRYRSKIIMAILALALAAGTTLAVPFAIRHMIDLGLTAQNSDRLNHYFLLLILLVVMLAISSALRYYFVSWLGERIVSDIRHDVFAHIMTLDAAFFDQTRSGEILSRLTADTTQIKSTVGSSISIALRNLALLVGAIIMMIITSPKLAGAVLLVIPLMVLPLVGFGRRVRGLSRLAQDTLAEASAYASEAILAVRALQSFTAEKQASQKFTRKVNTAFLAAHRALSNRAWLIAGVIFMAFISILAVLWYATQEFLSGAITLGILSQFVLYAVLAAGALGALSQVWADILQTAGAAERLTKLLMTSPKITSPIKPTAMPATGKSGYIVFENVCFSYASNPQIPILENINFTVSPGETIAIVGPSGAGKSTLFSLITRAYDATKGHIEMDGTDIRNWPLDKLRKQCATVPQDVMIFADSIGENISLGHPNAHPQTIVQAARNAQAEAFIEALPQNMQTIVGERGITLSSGQRQRIAIARALLKDAPILLLDEATSQLDAESEQQVQSALNRLMQGRTTLIIAHRLATVRKADRILVLQNGRIVENGTHNALKNNNGLYAKLAALQFQDTDFIN